MRTSSAIALGLFALLVVACGGGASSSGGGTTAAGAVSPVPAGYRRVVVELVVADVDAALAFYGAAFGATTTERIEGSGGQIVHGEMRIGDSLVMLTPEDPEHGFRAPTSASGSTGALFVYVPDVDASIAQATAAGAELLQAPTDMFWGDRYGQVRDSNGHRWSFATHTTDLTPDELGARSEAFMAAMASGAPPPALAGGTPSSSPIPAGYPSVTPMLTITGNEAVDFYASALGGEITERDLLPDGSLLHAEVRFGDSIVMFSSETPMEPEVRTPAHLGAATLTVMLYVPDVDATYTSATAAGATAAVPPADMFWGDRYGLMIDASGQAWGLATHVRDVSAEEMAAAAASM